MESHNLFCGCLATIQCSDSFTVGQAKMDYASILNYTIHVLPFFNVFQYIYQPKKFKFYFIVFVQRIKVT